MQIAHIRNGLVTWAAALAISACGGSGGGLIASNLPPTPITPRPTPTPTPAPPPPSPPPIPAGAIGLQSAAPFAMVSAYKPADSPAIAGSSGVQFSYSAADNRYTITLPGLETGKLTTTGGEGSFNDSGWLSLTGTTNAITTQSGAVIPTSNVVLAWPASSSLKYTSHARWYDPTGAVVGLGGVFAYGIPTAVDDVPATGTASYAGTVYGITNSRDDVFGNVSLTFNFGAGTLSGVMKPEIAPVWDAISLGDYTFRDTIYSSGSTSFSGAFNVPGSSASSAFSGSFTGPQAAELLASWSAPYLNPMTNQWDMMAGVWTAKKP